MTRNPERLLSLLIRAHTIDLTESSCSAAFRAGLKVGLDYPEIGKNLLERKDPEWEI
jgi:hypothetical protein